MFKKLFLILTLVAFIGAMAVAQEKQKVIKRDDHKHMEKTEKSAKDDMDHKHMKMDTEKITKVPWNKVCPVRGNEVDPEVETVEYDGKNYGFCCSGCDSKFAKNPEKYSKNLNDDGNRFLKKNK